MEMVMPGTYSVLENDEMMYLDGGWSWDMAFNNIKGLAQRNSLVNQAIISATGRTVFGMTVGAFIASYGGISGAVYAVSASIPGVGWIAGGSLAAFSFAIGTWRMFY